MKKKLSNIKYGVLSVFGTVILSYLQCFVCNMRFQELCDREAYLPNMYAFLNYILVGDNVGDIFYLSKTDVFLFFSLISCMFLGTLVVCYNFLIRPKGYMQFVAARVDDENELIRNMIKEKLYIIPIYVTSYYLFILFFASLYGYRFVDNQQVMGIIIWGIISKMIYLFMIKNISLILYFKKGMEKSIYYSICIVVLSVMLDVIVKIPRTNFLLASSSVNIIGNVVMILIAILAYILPKRINIQ